MRGPFRMKRLAVALVVALVLLLPALLRAVGLEPWPAMLLPDGANLVDTSDGSTHFVGLELHAITAGGTVPVDPARLIFPAPERYWRHMASRGFGILEVSGRERVEAEAWLQDALERQGIEASVLQVTWSRVRRSTSTGQIVSREPYRTLELPLE
jgi:hypothetical protein